MFSITAISIIPEVYAHKTPINVGYFILGGFFLQIVIDLFSHGVEHGHLHHHNTSKAPIGIFIALSLHAFLEGMAAGSELFSNHVQSNFVFGIALHEIPAAFALITILKASNIRKKLIYLWLVIYATMTVNGALIGSLVSHELAHNTVYLVALVIGVFLHISTTILFENTDNHRFSRYKLISIAIGVLFAVLSTLIHVH